MAATAEIIRFPTMAVVPRQLFVGASQRTPGCTSWLALTDELR